MLKHIVLATLSIGLGGCAYLEGPDAAAEKYFQAVGEANAEALKDRSASGLSVVDILSTFSKCGTFDTVRVTPKKVEGKSATFEVAITNSKGNTYNIPAVDLQKHDFRWFVREVSTSVSVPEVRAGGSLSLVRDPVIEEGPKMPEFGGPRPIYYVVKGTVGVCDADSAEIQKRIAKVESDKEPFLAKYREWQEAEAKRQEEKAAKERAEAEAKAALEASNTLLAQSGESMAKDLLTRYFKLLSARQAQQAANLIGDKRGTVTEHAGLFSAYDRRAYQWGDAYIETSIVRQAQYNTWGKKYPVLEVGVVTRYFSFDAKPGEKPSSRQTRMVFRLNEANDGLELDPDS